MPVEPNAKGDAKLPDATEDLRSGDAPSSKLWNAERLGDRSARGLGYPRHETGR